MTYGVQEVNEEIKQVKKILSDSISAPIIDAVLNNQEIFGEKNSETALAQSMKTEVFYSSNTKNFYYVEKQTKNIIFFVEFIQC